MPHAKFRGYRRAGSGEEDFLRVFSIYGRGGHMTASCHPIFISL